MERGRLCIRRGQYESVVIGNGDDEIEITVVRNGRGILSLLIEAPKDIPIRRKELIEREVA